MVVRVLEKKAVRFKNGAHIVLPRYCRGKELIIVPPEYKELLITFLNEKCEELSHV